MHRSLHILFPLHAVVCMSPMALNAQDSLNIRSVFHWNDATLPSSVEHNNRYNEIWGHSAEGREYAIIGSTLGTHIFDVTDPLVSAQVAFVPGAFQGTGVVHRDYKTFAGHLYIVCDEGSSTLQVVDLRPLPNAVSVVYNSNALFRRAHNIQIDTLNARMYTCGGNSQFNVYSLANPAAPTLLLNCEASVPWWRGAIGYVHDCYVRGNIVWTNDQDGMHVVDFTDIGAPRLLGSLTAYAESGYNHSGWLNGDGTLYAMADETHGAHLKLVDTRDLGNLNVLGMVGSEKHAKSIVHNPFFNGTLLHVAHYHDGYWLWDTADPSRQVLLGYYGTSTVQHAENYRGAWGVYPWLPSGRVLVSDMQTGLWVLDISLALANAPVAPPVGFRIWPTATDGMVHLTALNANGGQCDVEVIGTTGAVLHRASFTGHAGPYTIDLGRCADGPLLVRVTADGHTGTQRVIKTSGR